MAEREAREIIDGRSSRPPVGPGGRDAVHRACQDPDIQRWTTVPRPYLPEHAHGFVTELRERAWAAGHRCAARGLRPGTGELLGSCGLISIDRAGSGEIGYWTAPWARGSGVTVRAARAVARWSFKRSGCAG